MLPRSKRYIVALLLVVAGLALVPAYLHAYNLTGASEIPTILLGDKILVNNAAYNLRVPYSDTKLFRTGSPKRGDFVFLHLPNNSHLKSGFFKRILGLPGKNIELRENRLLIDGRALPVKTLNPADFAWVPAAHPIGSTVENEDGHWITFTPGKSEHRNHPPPAFHPGNTYCSATIATTALIRVSSARYRENSSKAKWSPFSPRVNERDRPRAFAGPASSRSRS
jgi:signal peptidase I